MNTYKILVFSLLCSTATLFSGSPVNFLRPYDVNIRPSYWLDQKLQLSSTSLFGVTDKAYNGIGESVNPLQYLHAKQDAIGMLKGFAQGTEQAAILDGCAPIAEDGILGQYTVAGDFQITNSFLFGARYHINNDFWIGAFMPAYNARLKNVVWTELTQSPGDTLVRQNITNNFHENVDRLGQGLNLKDWEKSGFGDLSVRGGWTGKFVQYKPWLKRVDTSVKVGFTFPTGVEKDEDKIMSVAFGNDGTVGLIVGAGLDLNFKHWCDAGVQVEFMHLFNNTRQRRIKTHAQQTEHLLLRKTAVNVDHGFTQKFNLYVEPQIFKGCSVRLAYQHIKQGGTTLYVVSNDYSSTIANTAEGIKEWTTHNVILQAKYDMATQENNKRRPQLSLYFNHPFNGRRSVQTGSIGCGVTFNF
jgi:hypothetical protein